MPPSTTLQAARSVASGTKTVPPQEPQPRDHQAQGGPQHGSRGAPTGAPPAHAASSELWRQHLTFSPTSNELTRVID